MRTMFTAYLVVTRKPDGTYATFLRNPDYNNLGLRWGLERLETDGNLVRLIGKRRGSGPERVMAQGDMRPMANSGRAMDDLISILRSREPLYARAEATLITSGKSPTQNLDELLQAVSLPSHKAARQIA